MNFGLNSRQYGERRVIDVCVLLPYGHNGYNYLEGWVPLATFSPDHEGAAHRFLDDLHHGHYTAAQIDSFIKFYKPTLRPIVYYNPSPNKDGSYTHKFKREKAP